MTRTQALLDGQDIPIVGLFAAPSSELFARHTWAVVAGLEFKV